MTVPSLYLMHGTRLHTEEIMTHLVHLWSNLLSLQSVVPHPHQTGIKNVNSDWTDDMWESKDAYLTRSGYR